MKLIMRFFLFLFCTLQLTAGLIIKEQCPDGFWLEAHLNDDRCITKLAFSDASSVCYEYENKKLCKIIRLDPLGRELYAQTYEWNESQLTGQTGWFTTQYIYDDSGRVLAKLNPWYQAAIEYDSAGKAVCVGDRTYSYDDLGQITSEQGYFHAVYGEACNLVELNGRTITIDEQNKIARCDYDSQGNLLKAGYVYDNKNQLIEACGERYSYDSYGRRIKKSNTCYLHLGFEEIASFENGQCKTQSRPETP